MNISRKTRITWAIIGMVLSIILSAILFPMVEDMKGDWRYHWESDFKAGTELLEGFAWFMVLSGVVDFILLIANLASQDDGATNGRLMPCPDCRKMVSRIAISCPHCGRNISRSLTINRNTELRAGDWKCSCGRVNPSYVTTCNCGNRKHDPRMQNAARVQWWICDHCKSENPPQNKHCVQCGAAKPSETNNLPERVIHCPECGDACSPDICFCPGCGTKLKTDS